MNSLTQAEIQRITGSPTVRYPFKVSRGNQMSIAAGFMTEEGILLCADSQYSGSNKIHERKLFSYSHVTPVEGNALASIAFALTGYEDTAKMAIEDCVSAFRSRPPKDLTLQLATKLLRTAVKDVYKEYIDCRPKEEQQLLDFQLIIACSIPNDHSLYLFRTNGPRVVKQVTYCAAGVDQYLSEYLFRKFANSRISLRSAILLITQAIAEVKGYSPHCGGPTQLMTVHHGGLVTDPFLYETDIVEKYASEFSKMALSLSVAAGDSSIDEAHFRRVIERFESELVELRSNWLAESSGGFDRVMDTLTKANPTNRRE